MAFWLLQKVGMLQVVHSWWESIYLLRLTWDFMVSVQILSTFFFIALLGGGAYLWIKLSGRNGGGGDDDGDDALAQAKRIMKKYK